MTELTIEQACEHPENFLYVWTTKAYLSAIDSKYATIIAQKAANQRKLLMLSADEYLGDANKWDQYKTAIANAFNSAYGMTPEKALYELALGKTVAGKNYEQGVFGIGATNSFANSDITVDPQSGYMEVNGTMVNSTDQIYDAKKGSATGLYQQIYSDSASGKTYVSQYNRITKKWYAASYSDADGNMYRANGSKKLDSSDFATLWEGVGLSLQTFIDWILSLFTSGKEQINEKNTVPNQLDDGYVFESGFGEAGAILLALAAGGALIATSKGKKGKKNAKKA